MKRLTREERRRLQRRSANIRFVAFILVLLAIGATIGYAAGRAQATQEPRTGYAGAAHRFGGVHGYPAT